MALQWVVFDASTLILLAKVDLLRVVAQNVEIHIPAVVEAEVLAKPEAYDAQLIAHLVDEKLIRVQGHVPSAEVRSIRTQFRLAEGEAAALWIAKQKACVLGIDDGPGIRAAKVLGIPFVTAIQVLVGLFGEGQMSADLALAKLDSLAIWGRYGVDLIADARSKIEKGGD